MEDRRRWGRQRKIEARREERESRRSFLKHYYYQNPWRFWAMVLGYLSLANLLAISEYLKNLTQLLKALVLIAKFCNGLIGVSLTDSLPAPLVN